MTKLLTIIGGSGVSDAPTFKDAAWKEIDTGLKSEHSDGRVHYQQEDRIIFIPRHGRNHQHSPNTVNYKANIMAASMLGSNAIIATSAVGAFADWKIGGLAVAKDYIDETGRDDNFFGTGFVVHAASKPSMSYELRMLLEERARELGCFEAVYAGDYCCIRGDRFGTIAEAKKRRDYSHIVGMSICPEAALAQQAGIHYAAACFIVDKDTDANHDEGTRAVMTRLSQPSCVPAYIDDVCQKTLEIIDDLLPLEQLRGNIIDNGGPGKDAPASLRQLADRLREQYLHNT